MQNQMIAKRYANALFDLFYSQSKGDVRILQRLDLLKNISESIQSNVSLKNSLFSPSHGIEEKKKILKGLIDVQAGEWVSSDQAHYLKSFFSILVKKNRLIYLPDIVKEIERLKEGLSKTTSVLLSVPIGLSDDEKNRFGEMFERMLQQKVLLTIKVSPELLGGMTLQIGSKVFDASLQMKLNYLRHELMGQ